MIPFVIAFSLQAFVPEGVTLSGYVEAYGQWSFGEPDNRLTASCGVAGDGVATPYIPNRTEQTTLTVGVLAWF